MLDKAPVGGEAAVGCKCYQSEGPHHIDSEKRGAIRAKSQGPHHIDSKMAAKQCLAFFNGPVATSICILV